MEKFGFIGYGNMGQMIIENILKHNIFDSHEMIVSNRNLSKLDKLKDNYPNIAITDDNKILTKNSSKIFIFVETPQFKDLINEISPFLNENSHIIHVCAGLSFENISNIYTGSVSQVIPSIASTFNEKSKDFKSKAGVSLILHNKKTLNDDKEFVEEIFNEFSYIEILDDFENEENSINNSLEVATILTSCGPAFISSMINNLADKASLKSENNLNNDRIKNMIVKTIMGTLIQIDTNNLTTDEIIKRTTTKKGITEIGLNHIDDNFDVLAENLFYILFKRYDEVKQDLTNIYSNS
ncbi:NAD(P)-binding domain-containing protein [Methanobrevibacter sp. TMH8]|uniref:NAD(P)-binding domain-containing protein n=1 Tax=Methanobrevibacter sp. TMH8 TaxID=2848611 RepID=UPI001CCA1010|nr:NAD(P)-binding domain-containing protein [Methanobrevibacter sp. TMH8]MBZ9571530.1 NAD(P)-binding domain-containing protein [Methanobrevibacter sp. TMH8]